MREIEVHETVTVTRTMPSGQEVSVAYPFIAGFVLGTLLRQSASESWELVEAKADIKAIFKDKGPGDFVEVSEHQWELLCNLVRRPHQPYSQECMDQCLQYGRAILNAKEVNS